VAKLVAQPACYISSLGSNPDISQKYKMGDMSKGVANTLMPAKKMYKKKLMRKFEQKIGKIFVNFRKIRECGVPERSERTVAPPSLAVAETLDPCPAGGHACVPTPRTPVLVG